MYLRGATAQLRSGLEEAMNNSLEDLEAVLPTLQNPAGRARAVELLRRLTDQEGERKSWGSGVGQEMILSEEAYNFPEVKWSDF